MGFSDAVDVNLADNEGKTALHWAAAVDNAKAIKMIGYRQGCKMDLQDQAGQTPLFLAAKEGNLDAVHELLEFRANIELANDEDKTPQVRTQYSSPTGPRAFTRVFCMATFYPNKEGRQKHGATH